ncbi:GNAT family N-acetyltransferase [Tersicoccus sp. Bi-70]|uniref:bifunctional acetate--CoA ligase family protein/GNAT family N-acetyltransferase n=1 Tax=Tersicoccus sp. Bi-70 TaxID=1897634 RepID=UPI000976357D|nr:GNAT family N-acetyltransferase [Tersicoccus sp. Bi-70]OMH33161.1 GNAT family N-acetyltransferase [Tersicoccus sp. Bi-70]
MANGAPTRGYPQHWEADVVLRDGGTAHLRPILPEDAPALQAMHMAQSQASIYLRFFTYKSQLSDRELVRFTEVDHVNRVAFIITIGEEIIGVGRYDRLEGSDDAEVAFNISDHHQGRGIGSILLEHLAAAAREKGIRTFVAEVLPENRKMLTVFADAGYEVQRHFDSGVVEVSFDIDPTDRSRAVMEAREHRAEAQSVAALLSPHTIAVIGSDADRRRAGGLLAHIRDGGFTGTVYTVTGGGADVDTEQADTTEVDTTVASLADVPAPVDLAVIAVAYDEVMPTVHACAAAGVRGLLVATGGYADDAEHGQDRQHELVRVARAHGMRVIGPASLGIVNTDPAVRLNASGLAPVDRGVLGVFTQSAALGVLMDAAARRRCLGVSHVVSAGNRADVSGNDVMQFWEDDAATAVVGLYLESIGNARKFSRIARRLARSKPVIVAKSDAMGLQLPPGHAARTSQAPVGALDAMMRQSGVIRVRTSEKLMEVAQLLVSQPLPAGGSLGVVANSLALGEVVADAAREAGLHLARMQADVQLGGDPASFAEAVRAVLADEAVHLLLVSLLPLGDVPVQTCARILLDAGAAAGKPVVAVFTGADDGGWTEGVAVPAGEDVSEPDDVEGEADAAALADPAELADPADPARTAGQDERARQAGLPCFIGPGAAIRAIAAAVGYRTWLDREEADLVDPPGLRRKDAAALIAGWLQDAGAATRGAELFTLDAARTAALLDCYGIAVLPSVSFTTADEAVAAADAIGWPVVLKTTDEHLRHRLDLGSVQLNIPDAAALRSEIAQMTAVLTAHGASGMEIQAMAPTGQGCVLRGLEDPLLGPVVSFGLAGDAVNLLDDWGHRSPPLTTTDVADLIRAPRAARKLIGHEGQPAVDLAALEDLVARFAVLKDEHPEVGVIEFNPVLASASGPTVLSALVRIGNPEQRTDSARRALRS